MEREWIEPPPFLDIDRKCFEVVYFMHASHTDLVKIGWTRDIERRFQVVQTSSPHPLHLLAIHPGGAALEAMYHNEFAHYHFHGEWFRLTREIRRWLGQFLRRHYSREWLAINDPNVNYGISDELSTPIDLAIWERITAEQDRLHMDRINKAEEASINGQD